MSLPCLRRASCHEMFVGAADWGRSAGAMAGPFSTSTMSNCRRRGRPDLRNQGSVVVSGIVLEGAGRQMSPHLLADLSTVERRASAQRHAL